MIGTLRTQEIHLHCTIYLELTWLCSLNWYNTDKKSHIFYHVCCKILKLPHIFCFKKAAFAVRKQRKYTCIHLTPPCGKLWERLRTFSPAYVLCNNCDLCSVPARHVLESSQQRKQVLYRRSLFYGAQDQNIQQGLAYRGKQNESQWTSMRHTVCLMYICLPNRAVDVVCSDISKSEMQRCWCPKYWDVCKRGWEQ